MITLPLIETLKIDTRRDGSISYAKVCVMLDGAKVQTDFRARLGEEPVTIEGDTIIVSDAQVQALRKAKAFLAADKGRRDADQERRLSDIIAEIDASIAGKSPSVEATAELHEYIRANAEAALETISSDATRRYSEGLRAIAARHGLLG